MSFKDGLEMVCQTDIGRLREHNEDSVDADSALGVAVLADGMGGYEAGEIASEIAVTRMMRALRQASTSAPPLPVPSGQQHWRKTSLCLHEAVCQANQSILDAAEEQPAFRGMGTTVVAVYFDTHFLSVAHVGDSRLYRLRDGELTLLTKDHSVLQELLDNQVVTLEQARHYPNRNLVTRALGVLDEINVEMQEIEVHSGDIYLLCSDGLNDMLEDRQIEDIVCRHSANLPHAARQLIAVANQRGGVDNISVILVRAGPRPAASGHWLQSMRQWFA